MKMVIIGAALCFLAAGCATTSSSSSSASSAVITALDAGGCDVETALTNAFGSAIAGVTGASSASACGAALESALGNINLCAMSVSSSSATANINNFSQFIFVAAVSAKWQTVKDIPASALGKYPPVANFKPHGVIGTSIGDLVCPVADSGIVGLLSGIIPTACQGPNSLSATAASQAAVSACEAVLGSVIPI